MIERKIKLSDTEEVKDFVNAAGKCDFEIDVCYSGHVGIYAGNNTLLHASSPSTGIKYTSPVTYREILAIRRIF